MLSFLSLLLLSDRSPNFEQAARSLSNKVLWCGRAHRLTQPSSGSVSHLVPLLFSLSGPSPVCALCIRNRWPSRLLQAESTRRLRWFVSRCTVHFLWPQRLAGTWVLYIEVTDLSRESWHTLGISFSLVAFLCVFLTDVLDLNNLFIFQLNFVIVLLVQINLGKVMMSGVHWDILLCPPFCKYFMNFYSSIYSGS